MTRPWIPKPFIPNNTDGVATLMKTGFGDIMQQAQQVQEQLQRARDEIMRLEVTGESGAGMVKVIMKGNHDIKRVEIDPALLRENKEMLEDLIAAAVNDANRRVEKETEGRMAQLTSGLNLPAGLKLPL